MGLFSLTGTVTAYGNSKIEKGKTTFDSITIAESNGTITHIKNVTARDPMNTYIISGADGEFFFSNRNLYGVKTSDGIVDYIKITSTITWSVTLFILFLVSMMSWSNVKAGHGVVAGIALVSTFVLVVAALQALFETGLRRGIRKHFKSSRINSGANVVKTRTI